jgi:adenylate cyclase
MTVVRERIDVEGQAPVTVTLRYTRHGPVVYQDSTRHRAFAVRAAWMEIGGAPDAILATFGVAGASERDAGLALECADGMLAALDDWNQERIASGEAVLGMGIGVNFGPAVIGDVGCEHSMSFTVIGDTVNTASRLQALTRTLNTPLLTSDSIVKAAGPNPCGRLAQILDRLKDGGEQTVRGRNRAVRIWFDPARRLITRSSDSECIDVIAQQ